MTEPRTSNGPSDETSADLAAGLAVVRAFGADAPVLDLGGIAERAGLDEDEARRAVAVLGGLGYVAHEARAYRLTPRVLELGVSYLDSLGFAAVAQPHLERLAAQLGETASAAVLDGAAIVYVARATAPRPMGVNVSVGTRLPLHATAMGRVLLAARPETEWRRSLEATGLGALTERTLTDVDLLTAELRGALRRGWALVDGEVETGVVSVAAPVHGQHGAIAAISVSRSHGEGAGTTDAVIAAVEATAREIENALRSAALREARPHG